MSKCTFYADSEGAKQHLNPLTSMEYHLHACSTLNANLVTKTAIISLRTNDEIIKEKLLVVFY